MPIYEVLSKVLGNLQDEQVRRTGSRALEIFAAFDRVGPPMSNHAEPVLFRNGVLTLKVDGPTWLTELSFLEKQVVDRLNELVGRKVVRSLRLRLGNPKPRPAARPKKRKLRPDEKQELERWTSEIKDEAVRDAVARAAATAIAIGPTEGTPHIGPPGPRISPKNNTVEPEPEHGLTYGFGNREVDLWKQRRAQAAADLLHDD